MTSSNRRASAPRASIAAHPLFPAIVALWFAALLGIGSLVLPAALFERLGAADMATRGTIALVAAVVGAGMGMMLARKAAAHGTAAPRKRAVATDGKRPILATAELGAEGFDEPLAEAARGGEGRWFDPPGEEGESQDDDRFIALPALAMPQPADEDELAGPDLPDLLDEAACGVHDAVAAPVAGLVARPLADLSMVELVERFALALQNAGAPRLLLHDTSEADSDTAPAGGLEAVALFPVRQTRAPAPEATETALREALARLQRVSGAA